MSDQVVFTKEEVAKLRCNIYWAIEHVKPGENGECPACFQEFNKALSLLDSPRPRPKVSLHMLDSIASSCYRCNGESLENYLARLSLFVSRFGFDVEGWEVNQ